MNFTIEQTPPVAEALQADRGRIEQQIRSITQQDTLITFVLILLTSTAFGFAVFWSTDSIKYAAIAFSVFPVIGVIAALTGLIATVGFRSNALRMIELKNELIALNPVSDDSIGDIRRLSEKYVQVDIYRRKVEDQQRALVNGELAMFWEWDASTQARTAKQRAYLESAHAASSRPGEDAALEEHLPQDEEPEFDLSAGDGPEAPAAADEAGETAAVEEPSARS